MKYKTKIEIYLNQTYSLENAQNEDEAIQHTWDYLVNRYGKEIANNSIIEVIE